MLTDCKVRAFADRFCNRSGSNAWKELLKMANHASALKAYRQNLKHRNRNRSNRSGLRTMLKQFNTNLEIGKTDEARNALPALYAAIDKSGRKKAISHNAAARQKSRFAKRLNAALAKAPQEQS